MAGWLAHGGQEREGREQDVRALMVSLSREKERLQRKIRDQALTIHQLTVQVEAVMATPEATQVSDDMPWVWLEGRRGETDHEGCTRQAAAAAAVGGWQPPLPSRWLTD